MIVRTTVKSIQDIMRKDAGVDGDAQRLGHLSWLFFLKSFDDHEQKGNSRKTYYKSPFPKRLVARLGKEPQGDTGEPLLISSTTTFSQPSKACRRWAKPGDCRASSETFSRMPTTT